MFVHFSCFLLDDWCVHVWVGSVSMCAQNVCLCVVCANVHVLHREINFLPNDIELWNHECEWGCVCMRESERKKLSPEKKMRIYTYSNNNITLYASSSLNWFPIHIRICVWIFQAHNFRRFSFSFLTLSYSPKIVTVCLHILDSVGLWVCVARNVCVHNGVCVCERPFSKPSIYCAFLLALSHFRIFQTLTQYFPSRFVRDVL